MAIKVYFGAQPLQYQSELEMQTYGQDIPNTPQPTWIELSGVDGLDDFEITFRKGNTEEESNNVTQESLSKELNFFDGSRNFLHEQLVLQKRELVYVKIEDDCPDCGMMIHYGVIKRKNLKSCDCDEFYSASINGISRDEVIKARLESITVMDNDLASYYNPNDNAGTNVLFQLAQESLDRRRMIDTYAVPGIPIRKIMESIGDRLSFNAYSSIFFEYLTMMQWSGDDYTPQVISQGYNIYNPYFYLYLVYFHIVNQRQKQRQVTFQNGDDQNNNTYFSGGTWQPIKRENWISWSAYSFLNRLAEVFNAQWRIKNGLLELERRDYFQLGDNQWLDLTNEKICYTIADFGDFAYLDIGFAGSKGEVQSTLNPRSSVNCGSSIFQNPFIDFSTEHLESLVSWGSELSFVKKQPLIKRFDFGYAPAIIYENRTKISLKNGTTPNPLLLIGAQNSAINRKFLWGDIGVFQHQPMTTDKYRYDYCINERTNVLFEENLYDNFHFIDDPNQDANSKGYFSKGKQYTYTFDVNDVTFNCSNFHNFDINKTILTKKGRAIMEEVTFNWSTKTMSIKGRV
jgi:hypothetical protein